MSLLDNGTFWITLTSLLLGSFALVVKYALKSKCVNVECCFGMFKVKRDIEGENKAEQLELEHGINPNDIRIDTHNNMIKSESIS